MKQISVVAIIAVVFQGLFGCSDDNEIDRTLDCAKICKRYSDCVTDIDVSDCTDYCEDQADAHPNIERAVDKCDDCLDGRSCDEQAACVSTCDLVPIPK
jgi:hypothetical protein